VASPAQLLVEAFESRFRTTPDLYRAPGRVNLIGEHTDYNLGFVLPIAIDMACYTASARNRDGMFRVYSLNLKEGREWPVQGLPSLKPTGDWSDYVIGVARQIPQTRGRDIMIYSSVPVGAGLSSSASLEVSTALAAGWAPSGDRLELAKLCRRAENDFVGLPSGIMDQYVSVFGEANAAVQIDCRSLQHRTVRLPEKVAIVAVNSMVKHELSQGAYRDRVAECARAAAALGVASLRDAAVEQLPQIADPIARKRAMHIVSENRRVLDFVAAAEAGNLREMGRLFVESHRSLQHDYEVSCAELDHLVDTAIACEGVYGARMTGGGFGGCTVNLVEPAALDRFEWRLRDSYRDRFGIDPEFYRVRPAAGASQIS
jgi:galactokinase